MADTKLSIAIQRFNDSVKVMNQTSARNLVLSKAEAQSLHSDIYALLAQIAQLSATQPKQEQISASADGGTW